MRNQILIKSHQGVNILKQCFKLEIKKQELEKYQGRYKYLWESIWKSETGVQQLIELFVIQSFLIQIRQLSIMHLNNVIEAFNSVTTGALAVPYANLDAWKKQRLMVVYFIFSEAVCGCSYIPNESDSQIQKNKLIKFLEDKISSKKGYFGGCDHRCVFMRNLSKFSLECLQQPPPLSVTGKFFKAVGSAGRVIKFGLEVGAAIMTVNIASLIKLGFRALVRIVSLFKEKQKFYETLSEVMENFSSSSNLKLKTSHQRKAAAFISVKTLLSIWSIEPHSQQEIICQQKIIVMNKAMRHMEKARFPIKHKGTNNGYKTRLIFADVLDSIWKLFYGIRKKSIQEEGQDQKIQEYKDLNFEKFELNDLQKTFFVQGFKAVSQLLKHQEQKQDFKSSLVCKLLMDKSQEIIQAFQIKEGILNTYIYFCYPTAFGKSTLMIFLKNLFDNNIEFLDQKYSNWQIVRDKKIPQKQNSYYIDLQSSNMKKSMVNILRKINLDYVKEFKKSKYDVWMFFDYLPKNSIIFVDQVEWVTRRHKLKQVLLAQEFFRVARNDSVQVSIIAASILPLTKLRLELLDNEEEEFKTNTPTFEEGDSQDQQDSQDSQQSQDSQDSSNKKAATQQDKTKKKRKKLSRALHNFSEQLYKYESPKGDMIDKVFTYQYALMKFSFKTEIQKCQNYLELTVDQTQEMLKDCFNGYKFQNYLESSFHPYVLEILVSIIEWKQNNPAKRPLVINLKTGTRILQAKRNYKKGLQLGYFLSHGQMLQHKDFNEVTQRILTKAGYYKGPFYDQEDFVPIPPNREVRITQKYKTFPFLYTNQFAYESYLGDFSTKFFRFALAMQQEAKIRLLGKPSKLIDDILDVIWLQKLRDGDFIAIKDPFKKIKIPETLQILRFLKFNCSLRLRVMDKRRCVLFSQTGKCQFAKFYLDQLIPDQNPPNSDFSDIQEVKKLGPMDSAFMHITKEEIMQFSCNKKSVRYFDLQPDTYCLENKEMIKSRVDELQKQLKLGTTIVFATFCFDKDLPGYILSKK